MDTSMIVRLLQRARRTDLPEDLRRELVTTADVLFDDLIVRENAPAVKESELLTISQLAERVGYTVDGIESAYKRHPDLLPVTVINGRRHWSLADWTQYQERYQRARPTGHGNGAARPDTVDSPRDNYPGGSSPNCSNYEIRAWMTVPQAAAALHVQDSTIRRLIDKALIAHMCAYKANRTPIMAVNTDEIYALVNNKSRVTPDTTVFDRWGPLSTVADLVQVPRSNVQAAAQAGHIASHRLGMALFVNIHEVQRHFQKT